MAADRAEILASPGSHPNDNYAKRGEGTIFVPGAAAMTEGHR